MSTVKIIFERTVESNLFMKEHHIPDTYERYHDMIKNFYPEFLFLVEENKDAVKYWVDKWGGMFVFSDFTNVIHEILYEESAKKSEVFQNRKRDGDKWIVNWGKKPKTIYYYDLSNKEWMSSDIKNIPYTNIISKNVDNKIKNTLFYKLYINNSQSVSNQWGIYGLLQEFCSYAADIRMDVISSTIHYHRKEFPSYRLTNYNFYKASILEYMDILENENPEIYKELIEDKELIELFTNICNYIDKQLYLPLKFTDMDEEELMIKQWSRADHLKEQMRKLEESIKYEITIKIA